MATISFSRPMTVNCEWGIKNLEKAIDNPISLSEKLQGIPTVEKATKEDYARLKEKFSK